MSSRISKILYKRNLRRASNFTDQITGGNFTLRIFLTCALKKEFIYSTPHFTLHSKIEWQRGKIIPLWRLLGVYQRTSPFLMNIGEKQYTHKHIFSISPQQSSTQEDVHLPYILQHWPMSLALRNSSSHVTFSQKYFPHHPFFHHNDT